MKRINSFQDLKRYISDQPLCDLELYIDYDKLVENVAEDLEHLLKTKHNFEYGQECPEISDDEFWDLFKPYEKEAIR